MRRGRLVFEQYFTGRDKHWGSPVGDVTFGPETLMIYGPSPRASSACLRYRTCSRHGGIGRPSLAGRLPGVRRSPHEPARMRILVKHALTMTMGTEWDEDLPNSDPRNGERQMEAAADRYRFVLDRLLVAAPGERWNYNGGARPSSPSWCRGEPVGHSLTSPRNTSSPPRVSRTWDGSLTTRVSQAPPRGCACGRATWPRLASSCCNRDAGANRR